MHYISNLIYSLAQPNICLSDQERGDPQVHEDLSQDEPAPPAKDQWSCSFIPVEIVEKITHEGEFLLKTTLLFL